MSREPAAFHSYQASSYDCSAATGVSSTECEALVALYDRAGDQDWLQAHGWLQSSTPCTWTGVTCEAGHVVSLRLCCTALNGTLPPELGNLSSLEWLDLVENGLTGTIPATLGNLGNLQSLDLSWNQLSGPIPSALGNLHSLQWLDLSRNALTGTIPSALGSLSDLQTLYLDGNQLSGAVPSALGSLTGLQTLGLSSNGLTGTIPSTLGSLGNLQTLYLDGNRLSGVVPSQLGNLTNAYWLDLSDNQLAGPLPQQLTQLSGLGEFSFSATGLCEPSDATFQGWLAGIYDLQRTAVLCSAISGQVTRAGQAMAGVSLALGTEATATTGSDGSFTFLTSPGTYVLTPTLAGYSFLPPTRAVTVPPAATAVNFGAVARPSALAVGGPATGLTDSSLTFSVSAGPLTTTLPITYTWQASGQAPVVHASRQALTDTQAFAWAAPGSRAITVTATNVAGSVISHTHVILYKPPSALAVAGPGMGSVGSSYAFSVTTSPLTTTLPITYTWQASGQTPVVHASRQTLTDTQPFAWASAGTQAITVTAQNAAGSASDHTHLTVYVPPSAVVMSGPETGLTDSSLTFSASAGPVTTTLPITYTWQASGQAPVVHASRQALTDTQAFAWAAPGSRAITVTATNVAGSVISHTHVILYKPPSALAVAGPGMGSVGSSYAFSVTAGPLTATLPITYTWQASGQAPVVHASRQALTDTQAFAWAAPGSQTITVTATNLAGSVIGHAYPVLYVPPTALAVSGPETGLTDASLTFSVSAGPLTTTLPVTYTWQASGQAPVVHASRQALTDTQAFAWAASGSQAITVTATNLVGDVTGHARLTLYRPVAAAFSAAPAAGVPPQAVRFANGSSGDYTSSAWQFGDGRSSRELEPVHTYATSGAYTVTLTVSGPGGVATAIQPNAVLIDEGKQAPLSQEDGGRLVYTDTVGYAAVIDVPPGGVDQAVQLVYKPTAVVTSSHQLVFAGHAFDLEAQRDGLTLAGFQFARPISITLRYGAEDVGEGNENALALMYWDGAGWTDVAGTCMPVSMYERHPEANWLAVPICHLSRLALMAPPLSRMYMPLIFQTR